MACRLEEIQEVGDHIIYEVADESVIVVRTGSATHDITAYINSCLHRGTQLRTEGGNLHRFRCPFHGFTWDLQGDLVHIPNSWDFPDIVPKDFCLPTAKLHSGEVSFSSTLMTTASPSTAISRCSTKSFETFR